VPFLVPRPPSPPIPVLHSNNCALCQQASNFHFSAVKMFAVGFTEGGQPQCVPCGLSWLMQNTQTHVYSLLKHPDGRSRWSRCLRRGSAAALLLGLWVRNTLGARMPVCCECCVLSGRGLCDGLITRPDESYRLWCV
jgi:hypothetical protein